MRGTVVVLAGLLALLSAATLIHILLTAVRRRARDLAILRTLGFVGSQVRVRLREPEPNLRTGNVREPV